MLQIFSRYQTDGSLLRTWLQVDGEIMLLEEGSPATPLTIEAILGVFARYGKPLDAEVAPQDWLADPLPLSSAASMRAFRFMNWGDVYKTDYLCLFVEGRDPLVAPSPLIAAALKALSLAILRQRGTT